MKEFLSPEELFEATRALISSMESTGLAAAAQELSSGFSCLNGLTDGWALFLDAISTVIAAHGPRLSADQLSELKALRRAAKRAVYR